MLIKNKKMNMIGTGGQRVKKTIILVISILWSGYTFVAMFLLRAQNWCNNLGWNQPNVFSMMPYGVISDANSSPLDHHATSRAITAPPQTLKALNVLWKPWRPKVYFPFEITTIVLVRSVRCIWIPMLWVYDHDHYEYVYSYSAGIDFRTSEPDVRFWRLMSIPAL